MIRFLFKGLFRDPNRSVFPVLVVSGGVMVTVIFYCWIFGVIGDFTQNSARMDTGHVKLMTRAYADIAGQMPNDLALAGVTKLLKELKRSYPKMDWTARIKFAGLLDFPDETGETRAQGPVFGMGIDLLGPETTEVSRLNLESALVRGRLPRKSDEFIVSEDFARHLGIGLGETATLISATANGSMAVFNFTLAGTVRFGIAALDKGAMLADIADIQYALDMADGAGEILGYFPDMAFREVRAYEIARQFNETQVNGTVNAKQVNAKQADNNDFTPVMITLKDQGGLGEYLDMVGDWIFIFLFCFVFVMSIVLWNTGLMSGIRRYGEIGVRLAIGESKGHVYGSLIVEAFLTGAVGSVMGTALGIAISWYLQEVGIDISDMMPNSTMLISTVIRARITPPAFFIGFIPGLAATTLGALISGITVFRRQTAHLFKELEA
jgi:putative ABC transport system permease protein